MVEVTDQTCKRPSIELCEIATQTEAPYISTVASPLPPALLDNESQTFVVKHTDTATQMTPPESPKPKTAPVNLDEPVTEEQGPSEQVE